MASHGRFARLLDTVEGLDDGDSIACEVPDQVNDFQLESDEITPGPCWNSQLSEELQKVVDAFAIEEFRQLDFSVTVADPSRDDCPLVACSAGFTELTGYTVEEIIGRNCRFLLSGAPLDTADDEARSRCRTFCASASVSSGAAASSSSIVQLPAGMEKPWGTVPEGEMICVQTNKRKTGELFRNMFYMKRVELDEAPYIVALQAGLPSECGDDMPVCELERICQFAFHRLRANMSCIEQLLSSQFWYSAPMRRQL